MKNVETKERVGNRLQVFEVDWRQVRLGLRQATKLTKTAILLIVILASNLLFMFHASAVCGVHMMLFWDPSANGSTLPSGWEAVDATHTLNGTDPTNLFIRGDSVANVGLTGGGGQTAPTVSSSSVGAGAGNLQGNNGSTVASGTHTHTVPSLAIGPDSNYDATAASDLPKFRSLELMRYTVGGSACIPNTIPTNAIALFTSLTGVSNVTRYTAEDNNMIRVWDGSSIATGGSDTVTNQVCSASSSPPTTCNDFTLNGAVGSATINNVCGLGGCTATAANNHTHNVAHGNASSTAPSGAAGNGDPSYNQPILGELTADTPAISLNLIAMFDADPSTGWDILSNSGGAYNGVFLRPNSAGTYTQVPVGQASHSNSYTVTSGTPSAAGGNTLNLGLNALDASNTHTHSVTVNLSSSSNVPNYVNVIVAQKVNFTLTAYRWYTPINNLTETDPWPSGSLDLGLNEQLHAIPAAYSPPLLNTQLRLRIQIEVTGQNLGINSVAMKLQYSRGTASSDCLSGTWVDVDSNSNSIGSRDWHYDSVSGLTDGTQLPSSLLTGTTSGDYENFYESASTGTGFTNPTAVTTGQWMEYDWAIQDNGATGAYPYYFRVVENTGINDDGRVLSVYSTCPSVITQPTTDQDLRHGEFFLNGISSGDPDQGFEWAN